MTNQSLSSARWKGWIVVLETFCVSSLYSAQHLSRVVNWRLKDSSQLVGNRTSSQKLHATIRITVHRRGKFLDFPRVFINIVSGLHQFLTPELHVSDDVDLNIISMSCVWSTWLHESVAHYWRSDSVLLLCQQSNKEWSCNINHCVKRRKVFMRLMFISSLPSTWKFPSFSRRMCFSDVDVSRQSLLVEQGQWVVLGHQSWSVSAAATWLSSAPALTAVTRRDSLTLFCARESLEKELNCDLNSQEKGSSCMRAVVSWTPHQEPN